MKKQLSTNKERRKLRVRSKIAGTNKRPRLSVFRSNRYIFAQLIDDVRGKTLVCVSEMELNISKESKTLKSEKAKAVGKLLAQKALKRKIIQVVFDRGSYRYHGRIKALADGAREEGLRI